MDSSKICSTRRTLKKGFSLLEILLVFGSIAILGGIFLPLYQGISPRNKIAQTQEEILSYLYQTRLMALSGYQNTDWGIALFPEHVILFPGDDFEKRNPQNQILYPLSHDLSFSPRTFVFSHQTGLPKSFGTLFLTEEAPSAPQISVRQNGLIEIK